MMQQNADPEICTRIGILREPAPVAHQTPVIGARGLLTYGDRAVCLSERNALLLGVLIYHFGSDLTEVELLDRVRPEGATRRTLRLQLRRLDRRLARVGLTIVDSGYRTYALRPVGWTERSRPRVLP